MDPPSLRYIVQATIIKYLVCSSDISRQHIVMLEYLRNFGQGIFGDEILSQIFEDFPGELTDELLSVLSPPHLKQLNLRGCNRLSCSGLQTAIAKYVDLKKLNSWLFRFIYLIMEKLASKCKLCYTRFLADVTSFKQLISLNVSTSFIQSCFAVLKRKQQNWYLYLLKIQNLSLMTLFR